MTKHTYTGDTADYEVEVVKPGRITSQVRITGHDSDACSIPVGTVVTVPNAKVL